MFSNKKKALAMSVLCAIAFHDCHGNPDAEFDVYFGARV